MHCKAAILWIQWRSLHNGLRMFQMLSGMAEMPHWVEWSCYASSPAGEPPEGKMGKGKVVGRLVWCKLACESIQHSSQWIAPCQPPYRLVPLPLGKHQCPNFQEVNWVTPPYLVCHFWTKEITMVVPSLSALSGNATFPLLRFCSTVWAVSYKVLNHNLNEISYPVSKIHYKGNLHFYSSDCFKHQILLHQW